MNPNKNSEQLFWHNHRLRMCKMRLFVWAISIRRNWQIYYWIFRNWQFSRHFCFELFNLKCISIVRKTNRLSLVSNWCFAEKWQRQEFLNKRLFCVGNMGRARVRYSVDSPTTHSSPARIAAPHSGWITSARFTTTTIVKLRWVWVWIRWLATKRLHFSCNCGTQAAWSGWLQWHRATTNSLRALF